MNKKENELFDLINDNGYDMEDLIESLPYQVTDDLIEIWKERIEEERKDLEDLGLHGDIYPNGEYYNNYKGDIKEVKRR